MLFLESSVLGFPRIGANREAKKAIESYWSGQLTEPQLAAACRGIRLSNWQVQRDAGITHIPSGDFSMYDSVLDHAVMFNVIPPRFRRHELKEIELYFAMARGLQREATAHTQKVDEPSCEMKKWFDSNYHFIVPEVNLKTPFSLRNTRVVSEFLEAKAAGVVTRPVLLGPISFLALAKFEEAATGSSVFDLLPALVPVYASLLRQLSDAGADWVQIDEPVLVLDDARNLRAHFENVYSQLAAGNKDTGIRTRIMLTTYFGSLVPSVAHAPPTSVLEWVLRLSISGLHIDLVRAPQQLEVVLAEQTKIVNENKEKAKLVLSLGVVSGRNVWKTEYAKLLPLFSAAIASGVFAGLLVSGSSSFLHVPHTLASEPSSWLSAQNRDMLAFAVEKVEELVQLTLIAKAGAAAAGVTLTEEEQAKVKTWLAANEASIKSRQAIRAGGASDDIVITDDQITRKNVATVRAKVQQDHLKLPKFPTTTIGSFPQTASIRSARALFTAGKQSQEEYNKFIKDEIKNNITIQERLGLDVFVHGEPERNDMVQYFAEQLDGFLFTKNGWVASYGTRYVRPSIIYNLVKRKDADASSSSSSDAKKTKPMTVDWATYAQSLTTKRVKGMLTGPVTILNWSFPRDDVPLSTQSKQIALALREEVLDLEAAGINVIQVDEPALREGLPLNAAAHALYLKWATDSFRLATAAVKDETQIHSHFCYSDFNQIFSSIDALDADVISIENAKSASKLLAVFKTHTYNKQIGPGVYDIHSPRVPSVEEIVGKLRDMLAYIPVPLLYVNPDCGLKTRNWEETEKALANLVQAAKIVRESN